MSDGNTTMRAQLSDGAPLPAEQRMVWVNYLAPGVVRHVWHASARRARFRVLGQVRMLSPLPWSTRRSSGGSRAAGTSSVNTSRASSRKMNALIVGVVNDSIYRTVRLGVVPTIICRSCRAPSCGLSGSAFSVTAKLTSPRALIERTIADAIGKAAPDLTFAFRDYSDQLRATVIQERLVALMSGFFGCAGDAARRLGVYGVTAYGGAGGRKSRFAWRSARADDVVRLVLGRVVALIAAGAAVGVGREPLGRQVRRPLLFGVAPRDPMTLVARRPCWSRSDSLRDGCRLARRHASIPRPH